MRATNTLSFKVNNNGLLNWVQNELDGTVHINKLDADTKKYKHLIDIPNGDMVMLFNLYQYIKRNDIQNDFINPYGKNKEA